jgi:hypothetical protein
LDTKFKEVPTVDKSTQKIDFTIFYQSGKIYLLLDDSPKEKENNSTDNKKRLKSSA